MLDVLFYVFGAMIVLPVLYLMYTKNLVRAAFALVVSLLGVAAFYVLLNAELMAVVQLLIYAGGVIVLLIFGIMLTKRISNEGVFTGTRAVIVGAILSLGLFVVLVRWLVDAKMQWKSEKLLETDQVSTIGVLFLTDHLLAFEVIAFLLLVALIGAAYFAKKSNPS